MRNKLILSFLGVCLALTLNAQTLRPKVEQKKVYNEDINPIEQIDQAIVKSKSEGKIVICQVGGNWCPWCLRFWKKAKAMTRRKCCVSSKIGLLKP